MTQQKRRGVYLFILLLLLQIYPLSTVTIGIIHDGMMEKRGKDLLLLEKEINTLVGVNYMANIPTTKIINIEYSTQKAQKAFQKLSNDPTIDIILSFGTISGNALIKEKQYPKNTMIIGILDPDLQGIKPENRKVSNVHHLSYFLFNKSLKRDLITFHEVIPYDTIGIVLHRELIQFLSIPLSGTLPNDTLQYKIVPIEQNITDITNNLQGIDALYLGYLERFDANQKKVLFETITKNRIPSFSYHEEDIKLGALAAISTGEEYQKVLRRIALNIEAILNGEKLSKQPVNLSFKEKLIINMATAEKIDLSPSFDLLAKATLFYERVHYKEKLTLLDIIKEVEEQNLSLREEQEHVIYTQKEITKAVTSYFPSLKGEVNWRMIDSEHAKLAMGQQPEQLLTGKATLQQLIFSEGVLGNIKVQKLNKAISEKKLQQKQLDITLEVAEKYFTVLMTQNYRKIQKDNITLIEENLELARLREAVGYSGKSDRYRWESNLATAKTNFLEAQNRVVLSQMALNQMRNKPLNSRFSLHETILDESTLSSYFETQRKYIKNPQNLEKYTKFLIIEAQNNSPEMEQLEHSLELFKRVRTSHKLKRFVPSIALTAQGEREIDRAGVGATPNPYEDSWYIGANLSLPLFNGGAVSVDIAQVNSTIRTLQLQKKQIEQSIELRVRAATLEAMQTMVNLNSSKEAASLANKSLRLVQDSYAKGSGSIAELYDAQNETLTAEISALNAVYEFIVAMLSIERAIGKFSIKQTTADQQKLLEKVTTFFETQEE